MSEIRGIEIGVVMKDGAELTSCISGVYDLQVITSQVNEVKPEAFIQVGKTLLARAGDIKLVRVIGEVANR